MSKSNRAYLLPTIFAACIAVGILIGNLFASKNDVFSASAGSEKYQKIQRLNDCRNY